MALTVVPVTGPYESRQKTLIALQILLISVALVIYCLRIYTRTYILRSTGNDDYIMGVAMIFSIGLSVNACISTTYGWGTHLYSIPAENFVPLLRTIWLSQLLFTLTAPFVKLSILFFYLRLAVSKIYRRVIYGSIAFTAAWLITFSCVIIFQCNPVSGYWNPTYERCIRPDIPLGIHGLTNILTDIYVFILPMPMVWKLHLPRRQRIWLLAIFGFGFLVCIAGALRLYYAIVTNNSSDSPWEGFYLWTWESAEVNLGIVCASATYLKPLLTRLIPTIFSAQSDPASYRQAGGAVSLGAGPHQQLSAGRNAGRTALRKYGKHSQDEYILSSVATIGSGGKRLKGRSESEDNLTAGHQILITSSFDCTPADDAV